jgi:hypothetical protein
MEKYVLIALEHIRHLSETIGGRGSCTTQAQRAAAYLHQELEKLGVQRVGYQPFQGRPSTYRPYMLAFGAALAGSLLALLGRERWALAFGAVLNLLGTWAMFAETEFKPHWASLLSPSAKTRNVTGVIPPSGTVERRAVLCAHFDTHRTPVFYSSARWQRLFGLLVSAAFISMILGGLVFGLGGFFGWTTLHWGGILLILFQAFVLVMVSSADFTPFSPGANDNASGVGTILGLVNRLRSQPLRCTEMHLVFTDCEETGAHGMIAYLEQNMQALGEEAVYIILDEVGLGRVKYIINDGLVIKHPTHPRALELERRAAEDLERPALEMGGMAYTDALPATLRGRIAITVCAEEQDRAQAGSHWHQMSDRIEFIERQSLQDSHTFTWNILQLVDGEALDELAEAAG